MHELATLLPALLASFLVGLSKGGLPAIGGLAVPIMALAAIPPIKAASLLLPVYVASDVVGVYLYRRDYSKPNLKILLPAGVAGVVIGWATAAWLSDAAASVLIGFVGVAFCISMFLRRKRNAPATSPSVVRGGFWGTLSGFTSFISHAGGPPFQIYVLPQKLPKLVFAGTSTITFAVINAAKIIPYANLRPYSGEDLRTAAILLPAALVGTYVGMWATRRIADVWFFRLVQLALFGVSLMLIVEYGPVLWARLFTAH